MKLKLLSFILLFNFISILFVSIPISVNAEELPENRTVIIKAKVDPRVVAEQTSATLIFSDIYSYYSKTILLTAANNYTLTFKTIPTEFTLLTGMVSNDYTGYYYVSCEDFHTYALCTEIEITIGDPNYKGEVVQKDYMVGEINREETDRIREQHGLSKIDWEKVDKEAEERYQQEVEEYHNNLNNPTETPNNNPTTPSTNETETPTENATTEIIPTETIATQDQINTSTPDEIETKSSNSSWFVILFIIALIIAFIISVYIRIKNSTYDN